MGGRTHTLARPVSCLLPSAPFFLFSVSVVAYSSSLLTRFTVTNSTNLQGLQTAPGPALWVPLLSYLSALWFYTSCANGLPSTLLHNTYTFPLWEFKQVHVCFDLISSLHIFTELPLANLMVSLWRMGVHLHSRATYCSVDSGESIRRKHWSEHEFTAPMSSGLPFDSNPVFFLALADLMGLMK